MKDRHNGDAIQVAKELALLVLTAFWVSFVIAFTFLHVFSKKKIYVSDEVRAYEVVRINPPKHFSVDLLDVRTHQLFERESRSKHCNNWRNNKLHEIVNIRTIYYKYEGSEDVYAELENINNHFCG